MLFTEHAMAATSGPLAIDNDVGCEIYEVVATELACCSTFKKFAAILGY